MAADSNKYVVRRFMKEALALGKLYEVDELLAPGYVNRAFGGVGLEEFKGMLALWLAGPTDGWKRSSAPWGAGHRPDPAFNPVAVYRIGQVPASCAAPTLGNSADWLPVGCWGSRCRCGLACPQRARPQ